MQRNIASRKRGYMKVDPHMLGNAKLDRAASLMKRNKGDVALVYLVLLSIRDRGRRDDGLLSRDESRPEWIAGCFGPSFGMTKHRVIAALRALQSARVISVQECGEERAPNELATNSERTLDELGTNALGWSHAVRIAGWNEDEWGSLSTTQSHSRERLREKPRAPQGAAQYSLNDDIELTTNPTTSKAPRRDEDVDQRVRAEPEPRPEPPDSGEPRAVATMLAGLGSKGWGYNPAHRLRKARELLEWGYDSEHIQTVCKAAQRGREPEKYFSRLTQSQASIDAVLRDAPTDPDRDLRGASPPIEEISRLVLARTA